MAAARTADVRPRLERVLEAFAAERLGAHHFASVSGYGHGDLGRPWPTCSPPAGPGGSAVSS